MKIDYDGRTWEFDIEDIPVAQCEAVEKFVPAQGMGDWSNKLDAGNTKAVIALWWMMRKQAGEEPGPISQPGDTFRPIRLMTAFAESMRAEAKAAEAAAAEADPTLAVRSSRVSAGTKTTRASGAADGQRLPG